MKRCLLLFSLLLVLLLLTVVTDSKSDPRIERNLAEHREVAVKPLSRTMEMDSSGFQNP